MSTNSVILQNVTLFQIILDKKKKKKMEITGRFFSFTHSIKCTKLLPRDLISLSQLKKKKNRIGKLRKKTINTFSVNSSA